MHRAAQQRAPNPHATGAYREGLREPEQQAATAACSGLGLPPSAGAPACDAMRMRRERQRVRRQLPATQAARPTIHPHAASCTR